ncbi:hypothetical protein B6N60_00833 [Richelia sinica FACHB-800]|uniref:Uncharacterized protein n=1 Tax=Richelia sinica FACHB-800 TaxID=1357546 RepID=A0A975Y3J1_9NOST|nr:hypothetical protein B6N60_00833 [Richelia sinica FACHB-800]
MSNHRSLMDALVEDSGLLSFPATGIVGILLRNQRW